MLKYAKKKGLRTMLLGSGIGPFVNKASSEKAKEALLSTDLIALRDTNSLDIINGLGLSAKAHSTADMAFLLSSKASKNRITAKVMKDNGLTENNFFIVALREWKYNAPGFEKSVAAICDHLAEKHGLIPVFIPVQPEKDLAISKNTISLMKSKAVLINMPEESLKLLPGLSLNSKFTISMRLHPIICSFVYSKPVIALSYDTKVSGFVEENNAGLCIDVTEVTEDKLLAMAKDLDGFNTNTSADGIAQLKENAMKNIDLAVNLMK